MRVVLGALHTLTSELLLLHLILSRYERMPPPGLRIFLALHPHPPDLERYIAASIVPVLSRESRYLLQGCHVQLVSRLARPGHLHSKPYRTCYVIPSPLLVNVSHPRYYLGVRVEDPNRLVWRET